jgi:hypothetical protein
MLVRQAGDTTAAARDAAQKTFGYRANGEGALVFSLEVKQESLNTVYF